MSGLFRALSRPDFCVSHFLCGSIETRLDFEDYVFKYENGIPRPRTQVEREIHLQKKVQRLCPSCVTRKNAKDMFLNYWKSSLFQNPVGFETSSRRKLPILYKLSICGLCNFLRGKKLFQKLKFWNSLNQIKIS
jgi:hypothetical protein